MGQENRRTSARLAHHIDSVAPIGQPKIQVAGAQTPEIDRPALEGAGAGSEAPATRRPALALTAEGPRRADLIAWASAHQAALRSMRLLAPNGIGSLLAEQVGLRTEPLRSGTVGPAATAGLAAAGEIDAMVAFTDPIELRAGDNTTRSLTRLAVFWDIPIASNRATADLLLARLARQRSAADDEAPTARTQEPVRSATKLWNVRATLDDVPGRLAILAASLARRAINILSVQVHLTPDGPVDELLVAAPRALAAVDLSSAVVEGGARAPRVTPADAHALVDGPTRALTLTTRLLRSPDDLPAVLVGLLPGAEVSWQAEEPVGVADDPTRLWLTDPTGGGFVLSRPSAPFTPAERARAYGMVDIAMLVRAQPAPEPAPQSWQLMLADGAELTVRVATPGDIDAVVDLHRRCSGSTRLRRYLSGARMPSTEKLARLLSPASGHALVVEDRTGRLVAMANLTRPSPASLDAPRQGSGTPELALLVEDGWQGRRIGTILARRLLAVATAQGVGRIKAVIHANNTAMVRIMAGLCGEPGYRLHREYDGGMLTLIASLRTDDPSHLA